METTHGPHPAVLSFKFSGGVICFSSTHDAAGKRRTPARPF